MNEGRFNKVDVIVGCVVLLTLCSVLAVKLTKSKHRPSYISCAAKLDRIGIEFTRYANDHNGSYPMKLSVASGGTREFGDSGQDTFAHFQALSNSSMSPEYLTCPQDNRRSAVNWESLANSNISYFVGVDADQTVSDLILAGDRNITTNSSSVTPLQSGLAWIASMGLHTNIGHVLFADGHVEKLDSLGLSNVIQRAGNLTNRVAVP